MTKARNHFDHTPFQKIFCAVRDAAYDEENIADMKRFMGLFLVAVDGSETALPNLPQLCEEFGGTGRCASSPTARMSIAYDVENDFILDADMTALSTEERKLALRHLEQVGILLPLKETLFIFDRGWSAYQEGAVESSDLREVETTIETRSRVTRYHVLYYVTQWADSPYYRCYRNFSVGNDFDTYHARKSYGEHNSYMWFGDKTMSVDAFNSAIVVPPEGKFEGNYAGYNKSGVNGYYFTSEPDYLWYQGDAVTENYDVTLYRYRDRTEKTVYTYSKLSDFSEWSETAVDSSDTTVVETRTLLSLHQVKDSCSDNHKFYDDFNKLQDEFTIYYKEQPLQAVLFY